MEEFRHPFDVVRVAFMTLASQDAVQPEALIRGAVVPQVNEHKGALGFIKIAIDLLSIVAIRLEIQQIVLNLKGRANKESESGNVHRIHGAVGTDEDTDLGWPDGRHPCRLLQDHGQIVGSIDIKVIRLPPACLLYTSDAADE